MEKPFQGLATFLKAPVGDLTRPIGVLGVPFDLATSNRAGARGGPNAIRKASMMLTDGMHPLFGIDPSTMITDLGDVPVSNIDLTRSMDQITNAVEEHGYGITPRRRLLAMGGDHTITTGILRALAPKNPDLFVLHLDAHCDTWPDHFGEPMGHGTWVRNVIDERLVTPHNFLQVGIRSPVDPETRDWLPMRGGGVFTAREALSEKLFVLRKMIPSD
ncbi:MAG: agmatinase, partial [Verrucomicrobiaceae bacterium]